MKKIIMTIFLAIFSITSEAADKRLKTLYISQVEKHAALDSSLKGIIDGLEKLGFKDGENLSIHIESADSNAAVALEIANRFANQNPDVVVGLGTTSAQALAKYAKDNKIKLIFSSVTDPVRSGLIKNRNEPNFNISGVSNFVDLEPQLDLFKKLQPSLKNLGFLYNPEEANSLVILGKLEESCKKFNINLVKLVVNNSSEINQATEKIIPQIDSLFISNDNTIAGGLKSIIKIVKEKKIPLFVSDSEEVKMGGDAALCADQYEIGIQTSKMIARVLKGEDINSITPEFSHKTDLYLNLISAKNSGLSISQNLIDSAEKSWE